MKNLLNAILNHPILTLVAFVLLNVIVGWQARHFEIDASADTLLTDDNQVYIQTQVMSQRFSPQEFLLIAYKPHKGTVLSQQTFANLASLTEKLKELDRVESVRSLLNVPLLSLMDDSLSGGEPSSWTLEQRDFSIEQLQKTFAGHPIYEELLVNKEQTATALQVLFKADEKLAKIQAEIVSIQQHRLQRELTDAEKEKIKQLEKQAEPIEENLNRSRIEEIKTIREIIVGYEDDADIFLGGVHVLSYQLIQIIKNDLFLFGGIIAAVICLTLIFLFRKLRWMLIPVICCTSSVVMTVGLFGLLGLKTTIISSNFIALQIILTLAIVIHLIVQYRELSAAQGDSNQRDLVQQTLLIKAKPCFYAGLTTAVGFASLLFTGIKPVISFGWMMIIAIFFSIVVSLILCPALMMLFRRDSANHQNRLSARTLKLSTYMTQKRPQVILLLSGAACLVSAAGLFLLNVENSFINYFDDSTRVHKELTFIDQELGGSTPLDVIITIPEDQQQDRNLVISAATVQELQQIQAMLERQEGMGKVLSIVNFTELAKQINDGKPLTEYELTALYRSLDKNLRDDLVGSFFDPEHSQIRISARIQDATDGLNRANLMQSIRDGMTNLGIQEENYSLTSLFVLYQDVLQQLFRSQVLSLGLVYLALTLTFFAIFRSVRIALIGIAPNILATLSVLGIMGVLGVPLDLMTITIASIAMGIAVDDTIHYTHRYTSELKQASKLDAVQRCNSTVGFAVLFTSIIIMLGFSMLGFSDFIPSVQFGLFASLAMAMATLWNLSLLPVLLTKFVPGTQSET